MALMDQVLAAAAPCLAGKTVEELVVGISLIGCCLSDGSVGVSYVMREELPNGCSAFPFAQQARIKTMAGKLAVFDHGVYLRGGAPDVFPTEQEKDLLPACDVVILSGTTTINGTIDSLLELCQNAREIVLVGTSTPMFPEGFRDTKVSRLAGAWWKNEHRREIFKLISLAAGISSLSPYMIHKNAVVTHKI